MKKHKPSGSAIFMYIVIAVTVTIAVVCFALYYGNFYRSTAVLWTGIASFTIVYHFWGRIIMGNVTKLFKIDYNHWWFKQRTFEKTIYKLWGVKKWKSKALTYNPELFSLKDYTFEDIAKTMAKVEVDHWVNELISLSTIAFGFIWGNKWLFIITAIIAMLFDAQFIAIQRFNRPRILKVIELQKKKAEKKLNKA